MGEAKRRGTREQRVAEAIARRQAAEQAREDARARRWAEMSQEQRDAALERAKAEARNYGQLQEIFGHETALIMAPLLTR